MGQRGNPTWIRDADGATVYKWSELTGLTSAIDSALAMGFDINSLAFASKEYYRYEYASAADVAELDLAMNEFYKVSYKDLQKYEARLQGAYEEWSSQDVGSIIVGRAKDMLPSNVKLSNELTNKQIGDIITQKSQSLSGQILGKATKMALKETGMLEMQKELDTLKKALKVTAKILSKL